MDRTGHMLDQRYRLGRILGQGGMASVYLGEDTKLGKAIAVKVLSHEYALQPKVVQRFTQEARAISKVRHPNVVDVTDHGVTPDRSVYLVMELLHGEDLSATLEREGPMAWARLGPIVLQICAALATVHAAGIVHRDIKPSNCFRVRVAGNPDFIKVLDFGIAKVLDGPGEAPQSTTGSLLGTPEYMAPELPRGLRPDARVDIYAVGVLMYKMLTGTAPFTGEVYMAILAKHMFDPVEPPRTRAPACNIPPEVEAVVLRALAKERDDRYPSMAALAEAVAATLPGQPSAALWLDASREGPAPVTAGHTVVVREPSPFTDLAHVDTSPRLNPDTLAHSVDGPARARRLRVLAVGMTAALAVVLGVVVWSLRHSDAPAAGVTASPAVAREPRVSPGTGPKGQVTGRASARTGVGGGASTSGSPRPSTPPAGSATPPAATPKPVEPAPVEPDADDEPAASKPAAETRPPLDDAAAAAVLTGLTGKIRRCAAEQAMLGGFTLQVKLDRRGQALTVETAPGSRKVPEAALACMRKVIYAQSFPASARGGVVTVAFPAS